MGKTNFPVHEDFAHFPAIPFPFNGVVVSLMNRFLHLDTWRSQRDIKNTTTKHQVSTADGASIEVLEFNPTANSGDKLPAILYFHGGAFALTYASTHVASMDWFANQANCRVFMVDYRLMPKHVFPTGFNDCYDSLLWLENNAERLNINKDKIVLAGDSAGGAFAASVAQKARDEKGPALAGQLLIYPVTDSSCSTESAQKMIKAPLFDAVANKKMWEVYLRDYSGKAPKYAAAIDADDFSDLPTAYVENAEFDPLRDEGRNYAQALEIAGVEVTLHETKGTIHGYDSVSDSAITQESLKKRLDFLAKVFA